MAFKGPGEPRPIRIPRSRALSDIRRMVTEDPRRRRPLRYPLLMALLTLGISYRSASLDLLERLSYDEDSLVKAYRMLQDEEAIGGAVILSTCNRVEILASVDSYHSGFVAVRRVLSQTREVEPDALGGPLYSHWEQDAAAHLFDVASG